MNLQFSSRKFLFLQGPHGPFFRELAQILAENGADVERIAFNAGDRFYWSKSLPLTEFQGDADAWRAFIIAYLEREKPTDLVLYAESRPIHIAAIEEGRKRGVVTHFFEEGYLRPYWVSYEREGVNGNSPVMNFSMDDIRRKRAAHPVNLEPAPAAWGNIWHHNWYGFTYHFNLWLGRKRFPNYKPHRNISLFKEWRLNAVRLLNWPLHVAERDWKTHAYLRQNPHYHVVLLQLEHDASLRVHSDYETQRDFIYEVVEAFTNSAPRDLDLVFKFHPLEDRRVPIEKWIKEIAKTQGVNERVHVFSGGKLGELLDHASGAVTVNSTSAQQVLWRNLPLKMNGRSVFDKPEFVFGGDLDAFFSEPRTPDYQSFLEYRSFLLETSQIPGGFYSKHSRQSLLGAAPAIMASKTHPYEETP